MAQKVDIPKGKSLKTTVLPASYPPYNDLQPLYHKIFVKAIKSIFLIYIALP